MAALAVSALALGACSGDDFASPTPVTVSDAGAVVDASLTPDAGANDGSSADAAATGDAGAAGDAGPSGDASADGAPGDGGRLAVSLQFAAKVGPLAFACGKTYAGQGSTNVAAEPRDFRFYVQDVRLVDGTGSEVPVTLDTRSPWQTSQVALLDFEDGTGACAAEGNPETNTVVTGTVPPGTYTGIAFRNGVPDSLNHADPLQVPAPLQPAAMTWGWLFGYKFIKAELAATGAPTGDAAPGLGLLHLGSTGCANSADGGDNFNAGPLSACANPNRNEVHLTGYTVGGSVIVADIGAAFQGVDLSTDNQCHSGGESCPPMFAAAGVSLATGTALVTQSIYRLE